MWAAPRGVAQCSLEILVRLFLLLLALPAAALAQNTPDLQARVTALEAATRSAQSAGDHAWMLVSSALVLMMTGPGLALFYSGLVRQENVLGVMIEFLFPMGLMTVLWAIYGYSLSFGGDKSDPNFNAWLGNSEFVLMQNVQPEFK